MFLSNLKLKSLITKIIKRIIFLRLGIISNCLDIVSKQLNIHLKSTVFSVEYKAK